jgi:hypothetical protein
MKKLYITLTIILLAATNQTQAQSDTIYFWRTGQLIHKRSMKPADLDSITFKRPCSSGLTAIVNVTNPGTGKIWMDRNLGASRAAISSTDSQSYGDLYQWGRRSDGHQCRTSLTTSTLSSVDQPANGNFILIDSGNLDWRSPQNTNLWQGVNGVNNPCPNGYRLPTDTELNNERLSWSSQNSAGAFASPLKLPMAGTRNLGGGFEFVGGGGYYWSSTVSGTGSRFLVFLNTDAGMSNSNPTTLARARGHSVRCIKD